MPYRALRPDQLLNPAPRGKPGGVCNESSTLPTVCETVSMKIFYDWEFLDTGRVIEPISLGMVTEEGAEYYAVFSHITMPPIYAQICRHSWLMHNVVIHLPLKADAPLKMPTIGYGGGFRLDRDNPVVKTKAVIRAEVKAFLDQAAPVELWGYYPAYDHVLLAQLFGSMVEHPASMSMVTFDVAQLCNHLGRSEATLPADPQRAHNALEDARWTHDAYQALIGDVRPSWVP